MITSSGNAYVRLCERFREISYLGAAANLLSWDEETGMPPKALDFRARQLGWLAGRVHDLQTAPEVGEWLDSCASQPLPVDSKEAANVREWKRHYRRHSRLPSDLVVEEREVTARTSTVWREARKNNDFKLFQPHLERIVELARRKAELWGYSDHPYDALLEEFEPGTGTAYLKSVLGELAPRLSEVAKNAVEESARRPVQLPPGAYPIEQQQRFNRLVAESLGFDFESGRIDTTTHPFCSRIHPGDVRLTTRYDESDFTSSLYGVLHEAGHGLYEQGLPESDFGRPSGEAVSLGIHESQSRLWENHVGRSRPFWETWFDRP